MEVKDCVGANTTCATKKDRKIYIDSLDRICNNVLPYIKH